MTLWPRIADAIAQVVQRSVTLRPPRAIGGGCINESFIATESHSDERYFIKINRAEHADMFAAEAEGLTELGRAHALVVPAPITFGVADDNAYLVLEYLDFGSGRTADAEQFGTGLAALHRTQRSKFGWHRNNTIGTTPQINDWNHDWVEFWRQHRLGFQLQLAAEHGAPQTLLSRGRSLMDKLAALFIGYTPQASLLHGDLWSGNYRTLTDCRTAIFDPAVYFGDREADIAMTELFGGFAPGFYAAYNTAYPLHPDYAKRKTLYNLYHILNHYNLFGGGYLGQAARMIDDLLKSIG